MNITSENPFSVKASSVCSLFSRSIVAALHSIYISIPQLPLLFSNHHNSASAQPRYVASSNALRDSMLRCTRLNYIDSFPSQPSTNLPIAANYPFFRCHSQMLNIHEIINQGTTYCLGTYREPVFASKPPHHVVFAEILDMGGEDGTRVVGGSGDLWE
jgi:hypothetical protein